MNITRQFFKFIYNILLHFLQWASSDRNRTSTTSILSYGVYSWLTNWLRVRNSVKTVKFRSWKFHLQKLKMGQRFGQYSFIILFGIFDFQYPNLVLYHHQLTDLLVSWRKFHLICQICVQKISYLKMGQTFENTTFRFVKLFAVGFLRSKSNFH